MKLTKETIRNIGLDGKAERIVFDESLPGFGLRLREGGSKKWVIQYRVGQKQRRVTIGSAETLDPEQARKRAKAKLAQVHLGGDPQLDKVEVKAQATLTLGKVADDYLRRYASNRLKPRTLAETDRYLRQHWKPLSRVPIQRVSRADVASRLATIAEGSGGVAANRARAALGGLFSWAIAEGLVESSPVVGTRRPVEEETRDRVLADQELKLILQAAGEGDYGDILRLLILTGQRREEVAAMMWSEIDAEGATWCIGRGRTKNSRPHDVPLTQAALEILQARERQEGRDLVFGRGGPFSGWSKAKAALDRRSAKANGAPLMPWRLHDIRRTVATRLADIGVLPHVVEAVLNHVSGHKAGVAGIYNRSSYANEKRAALVLWADYLAPLTDGVWP